MADNEIDPDGAEDRTDTELDAMLAAADDRLLDAVRRNLDLDAGLAQIIGDPPRRETSPPVSAAGTAPPCADDVSSRIALLRFQLLDLTRSPDDDSPVRDITAALLQGAASSLKDLNRGLDARELALIDAISLVDDADLALEKALATQKGAANTLQVYSDWRMPLLQRLIIYGLIAVPVIAVPTLIALVWTSTFGKPLSDLLAILASAAIIITVRIVRRKFAARGGAHRAAPPPPGAHRAAARPALAKFAQTAGAGFTVSRQRDWPGMLLTTPSGASRIPLSDRTVKISSFRKELGDVYAGVMELFDEADDYTRYTPPVRPAPRPPQPSVRPDGTTRLPGAPSASGRGGRLPRRF
jgi:hypothetical protein